MVSQHGILLAVGLISDHFGSVVSKVCECLLRHGPLQLPEIARRLKLPRNHLKNSLLVLIQHNCVQAFSYPSPRVGGRGAVTLYLAIFDNVLHRLHFSKFLSVIRADIPESEVLIEGLLQNGRLTFDQLVEYTTSQVEEGSSTTRPEWEEIRLNFNKLVCARYVERCPKPEPSFNPDDQPTPVRRRVKKTVEEVLSLEQKIVNAARLSDPERFSEIPYSMEDASNANDCPQNAVSGAKRKHGAFEVDEERNSTSAENEILWRTNFEKFIFCLKKKFCADRKKPKLKIDTHPIWESFFEANLTEDTNSVTSSLHGILERLGKRNACAAMTLDQITRVLEDLQCTTSTDDPEAFTFGAAAAALACWFVAAVALAYWLVEAATRPAMAQGEATGGGPIASLYGDEERAPDGGLVGIPDGGQGGVLDRDLGMVDDGMEGLWTTAMAGFRVATQTEGGHGRDADGREGTPVGRNDTIEKRMATSSAPAVSAARLDMDACKATGCQGGWGTNLCL